MRTTIKKIIDILNRPGSFTVILAVGLVLRLIALILFYDQPFRGDTISYHRNGVWLAEGSLQAFFWPPGVSLYLAVWYWIFGAYEFVGRLAMLALWLGFSWLLYSLTSKLAGRIAANFAVLCFALYPNYIYQSVTPLTQLPTATLLLLIVWFAHTIAQGSGAIKALGAGMAAGFMTLVRASSSPLLALVPAFLWFRSRKLQLGLAALAGGIVVVLLWLGYAYRVSGRFVFVNDANAANFFRGNNVWTPLYRTWWFGSHSGDGVPQEFRALSDSLFKLPVEDRNAAFMHVALDHIKRRPDMFIVRTLSRIRCYFGFDHFTAATIIKDYKMGKLFGLAAMGADALIYLTILVLAIYGLCFYKPPFELEILWLIIGLIAVYAAPYFISWAHSAYHFPIMPLFGILAGAALSRLSDNTQKIVTIARKRWFIAAMVLLAYIQVEWAVVSIDRL